MLTCLGLLQLKIPQILLKCEVEIATVVWIIFCLKL